MLKLTDYQKAVLHESGHAVVYHILGRPLQEVWAKENGDGFCKPVDNRRIGFPSGISESLQNELTELALICFSGYVAETEYSFQSFKTENAYSMGKPLRGDYPENDFGNLRSKMHFANNLAGDEYFDYSFFAQMHGLTVHLIKHQSVRNAVCKIAEGLFSSPDSHLTGEQVHSLCNQFITMGEGMSKFINPALSA
jgi:hypothetical protein